MRLAQVLVLAVVACGALRADGISEERRVKPGNDPGAQAFADGLDLPLEGVDAISGAYSERHVVKGIASDMASGQIAGELPSGKLFSGTQLRLQGLVIERLGFEAPAEALEFASRLDRPGEYVVEARGKEVVILTGAHAGDPEVAGQALRMAWDGSRYPNAPRALLAMMNPDGDSASHGASARGPLAQSAKELLRAAGIGFGSEPVGHPTPTGFGTLTWLDGKREGLLLESPGGGARLVSLNPDGSLVQARGTSRAAMDGMRLRLSRIAALAPAAIELPLRTPLVAQTPPLLPSKPPAPPSPAPPPVEPARGAKNLLDAMTEAMGGK